MLTLRPLVTYTSPAKWLVCFRRTSPLPWVQRLVPGDFKHVQAFGAIPGSDLWVFFQPGLNSVEVRVVPDAAAAGFIAAMIEDAVVVEVVAPVAAPPRPWWKPMLFCTGMVAGLVGCRSGALRPDRFLRDLLAEGATIIDAGPENGMADPTEAGPGAGRG